MNVYFTGIILVFIFYVLFPGIGAFVVRRRWRKFRRTLISSTGYPEVDYSLLADEFSGYRGKFKFFGVLQAINKDDEIWLEGDSISLSANMKKAMVYIVPLNDSEQNNRQIECIEWNRLFPLAEGSKMFIAGPIIKKGGKIQFAPDKDDSLLVVLYEGSKKTFLTRSISGGRQSNELWNFITPWSLFLGSIIFLILSLIEMKNDPISSEGFIYLILSIFPLMPIIPPGLFLFFLYNRLWKKAVVFREERDLYSLPMQFFCVEDGVLKEYYEKKRENGSIFVLQKIGGESGFYPFKTNPAKLGKDRTLDEIDVINFDDFVFGEKKHFDNGDWMINPADPMIEMTVYPGNPAHLSDSNIKRARRFEIYAGLAFLSGFLINLVLCVYLIDHYI